MNSNSPNIRYNNYSEKIDKVISVSKQIITAIAILLVPLLASASASDSWTVNTNNANQANSGTWLLADINGDKMADIVNVTPANDFTVNLGAYLSNGDGTYNKGSYQNSSRADYGLADNWYTLDLNGDGKMDVVQTGSSDNTEDIILIPFFYNGTNPEWKALHFWDTQARNGGSWFMIDVNNDKKTDTVNLWSDSGKMVATTYFSKFDQKDIGNWKQTTQNPMAASSGGNWLAMNVNGDNYIDFVNTWSFSGNESFTVYISNGEGSWTGSTSWATGHGSGGSWVSSDINGDGKGDIINFWSYEGNQVFAPYLSNGDGSWTGQTYYSTNQGTSGSWLSMDLNGDGREDILNYYTLNKSYAFRAYISTKVTTNYSNTNQVTWEKQDVFNTNLANIGVWLSGDVNGDGKTDMVNVVGASDTTYFTSFISQYE